MKPIHIVIIVLILVAVLFAIGVGAGATKSNKPDAKTDTKHGNIHDLGESIAPTPEIPMDDLSPKPSGRLISVALGGQTTVHVKASKSGVRSIELKSLVPGEVILSYTPTGKKPMLKNIKLRQGKSIRLQVMKEGGDLTIDARAVPGPGIAQLTIVPPKK